MPARSYGPDGFGGEAIAVSEPSLSHFFRMLADAPDGGTVAHAVCRGVLPAYGAELVTIYLATPDRTALDLFGQWGLEHELVRLYARLPMDLPSPERDAYLSGSEAFVSARMVAKHYPIVASYLKAHPAQARSQLAYLPLRRRGIPVGVLGLRFHQPVQRTWQLRETLDALVSGVALWASAQAATVHGTDEGRRRLREVKVSNRQREVLALVRDGRTNAEIARRLGYSEVTIKADLTALYKLLGASGRDDLVDKAARAGL